MGIDLWVHVYQIPRSLTIIWCMSLERVVKTEAGEVVGLEDLMIFFSGTKKEPPLGFSEKPTLEFTEGNLATSSTCLPNLRIPIDHSTYSSFKHYMTLSLMGQNGFGSV